MSGVDDLDGADGYLVLSPHLDDAVLSCGALLAAVAPRAPVTVVTVFTAADAPPHTLAARSFLRSCAVPDAAALYAARRAEDRAVLDGMGVRHRHLGLPDALFRRRDTPVRGLARWVPELGHRYPTYRFDIARGRVSRGDAALVDRLAGTVAELVAGTGARVLLCPLGVGRHVDHLLTRAVGPRFADRVVYYAEFPYTVTAAPDAAFVRRHGLVAQRWVTGLAGKEALIRGYRTQTPLLFPDGRIPRLPELYFRAAG
jgi:LmbE family N-acetylglucosaminyl deacetylase